jgi:hypothetical protein
VGAFNIQAAKSGLLCMGLFSIFCQRTAAAAMSAGMLSHVHEVSASAEVVAGLKICLYWMDWI